MRRLVYDIQPTGGCAFAVSLICFQNAQIQVICSPAKLKFELLFSFFPFVNSLIILQMPTCVTFLTRTFAFTDAFLIRPH